MAGNFRFTARRAVFLVLVLYWSAMFVGTHRTSTPESSPMMNDKALHFGAYCGLSFLFCWTFLPSRGWKGPLGVMAVIATYGCADEWTQLFVPTRSADVADWLADIVGGLVGLAIYLVIASWTRERAVRRSSTPLLIRKDAA